MGRKFVYLLALAAILNGCYVYEPVRPGDALVGERVRATVSPQQAAELEPVLRNVTPQVQGTLVQRSDASLMLDVPLYGVTAQGLSTQSLNNRIAIQFTDLVSLETRRLSTWRTVATVGAVAVGLTGAWAAVTGLTGVDDKQKTGVENSLITIFSLPFAIFE